MISEGHHLFGAVGGLIVVNPLLQHQRLTYEMMAVLFGEEPILEDENGRWPSFLTEESA